MPAGIPQLHPPHVGPHRLQRILPLQRWGSAVRGDRFSKRKSAINSTWKLFSGWKENWFGCNYNEWRGIIRSTIFCGYLILDFLFFFLFFGRISEIFLGMAKSIQIFKSYLSSWKWERNLVEWTNNKDWWDLNRRKVLTHLYCAIKKILNRLEILRDI